LSDFVSDLILLVALLYLLEALLLGTHALRHQAGLFPVCAVIITLLFFMMLMDPVQAWVIGPRGITLPVNSLTVFPTVLFGVVLIYITEGPRATWILFGCLLGVYALVLAAEAMVQLLIRWPLLVTAVKIPEDLFPINFLGTVRSAVAFAVDVAVVIGLFTLFSRHVPRMATWLAVCIAFAAALVADGVVYPMLSMNPPALTLGHVLGKFTVALLMSLPLILYLRHFSPRWLQEEIVGAEHFDLFQASGDLHQSLRISERRFREIIDQSPSAIVGFNRRGRVILWNRAAETIYGHPGADAQGRPAAEFLSDGSVDQLREVRQLMARVFEGQSFEAALQTTYGHAGYERHLTGNLFPLRGVGGEILFGVAMMHDVTRLVEMERTLARTEQRFDEVANSIREGMAVVDQGHTVRLWNRAAEDLTGRPAGQVVGRPLREALADFLGAPVPALAIDRALTHAESAVIGQVPGPGKNSRIYEARLVPVPEGVAILFSERPEC
jgi:PAS domain S-box-containing protein